MSSLRFPPPKDWQAFERLCRDVWSAEWQDDNAQQNGRSGQRQNGVDIFGQRRGAPGWIGVQCKNADLLTASGSVGVEELEAEVEKAKSFTPKLSEFHLAYTGPRDARLQEAARAITERHQTLDLFQVVVQSWEEISDLIEKHPKVWASHFPALHQTSTRMSALAPTILPADSNPASPQPPQLSGVFVGELLTYELSAEHDAAVELIRGALRRGNAESALQQVRELRSRIWQTSTASARARLVILEGHCHFASGAIRQAGELLRSVSEYSSDDAELQAQIALGHSLLGDNAAAIHWARKSLSTAGTNLVAVQVCILHDDVATDQELLEEFASVVGKRPEVLSALGHRAAKRGDVTSARSWFEEALKDPGTSVVIRAVAGQAIVDAINTETVLLGALRRSDRDALDKAILLLDEGIASLRDPATRRAQVNWYGSKIVAKRLLRHDDQAQAIEEAIKECGPELELLRLRIAVASDAGDHRRVLSLVEAMGTNADAQLHAAAAAAHGNLGAHEVALKMWTELEVRPELSTEFRHELERNHALTLLELKRPEEAREYAASLVAERPGDLGALLVELVVANATGAVDLRDQSFGAAIACVTTAPSHFCLRLADCWRPPGSAGFWPRGRCPV